MRDASAKVSESALGRRRAAELGKNKIFHFPFVISHFAFLEQRKSILG
jgi:hypothetical protein